MCVRVRCGSAAADTFHFESTSVFTLAAVCEAGLCSGAAPLVRSLWKRNNTQSFYSCWMVQDWMSSAETIWSIQFYLKKSLISIEITSHSLEIMKFSSGRKNKISQKQLSNSTLLLLDSLYVFLGLWSCLQELHCVISCNLW